MHKIVKILIFIIFDISVFIFLGIFMMGYDDFYDSSKGEYFALSSMEIKYKIVWIFYNFWIGLNALLPLFIFFKIYKKISLKNKLKT